MIADFYIKLAARKSRYRHGSFELDGVPKGSKTKPDTGCNEVALHCKIEIPDTYFADPIFSIELCMPERPNGKIPITTTDKIAKILQANLGVKAHVTMNAPEIKS